MIGKSSSFITTGVLLTGLALTACNSDSRATDSTVDGTYQKLAGQFTACAVNAASCLKAANCDEAAGQVCRDDFATCREAARAAAEAFHDAVHTCKSNAHACWEATRDAGGGDAGAEARSACWQDLRMCVADAYPERAPAPPCLSALRDCIQADNSDVRSCMQAAHSCFVDSLPPRCDGDGGVVDGGWFDGRRGGDHDRGDRGDRGGRWGGRDCKDGGPDDDGPGEPADAGMSTEP